MGIFVTPASVIFGCLRSYLMWTVQHWRKYKILVILYFLNIKPLRKNFTLFFITLFYTALPMVDFCTKIPTTFLPWQITKVMQMYNEKYSSHALATCTLWDGTLVGASVSRSSFRKQIYIPADSLCLRQLVFPYDREKDHCDAVQQASWK
jgi:hypothetical protein